MNGPWCEGTGHGRGAAHRLDRDMLEARGDGPDVAGDTARGERQRAEGGDVDVARGNVDRDQPGHALEGDGAGRGVDVHPAADVAKRHVAGRRLDLDARVDGYLDLDRPDASGAEREAEPAAADPELDEAGAAAAALAPHGEAARLGEGLQAGRVGGRHDPRL